MAQSLRDQFLKMGLVDKKQASQAQKTIYKKKKEQNKGRLQGPDDNTIQAQQALTEKKNQARLANEKRQQELKKHEAIAQLRQLISSNIVPLQNGTIAYHFTDQKKVVKILVPTTEMVDDLSQGRLAIIREKNSYAVIPVVIAERIKALQPDLIVVCNVAAQQSITDPDDPDDPYAAFTIPDDLIW